MNAADPGVCPIAYMNHCLYEHCPYWDQDRQECDAACLGDAGDFGPAKGPCVIHWTEDFD